MINNHKVGLILGSFAALIHLVWALLVASGSAKGFLDFIYRMHFLSNPFVIQNFFLGRAVGLVIMAFLVAYIVGNVLAIIWNHVHRS